LAGKFVVFEGADGCGKSTQLRRFADLCVASNIPICEVREPGGTDVGERVRTILLDKQSAAMTLRCEMLLYMASRAQLVEQKVVPALKAGNLVLTDRFIASTYAYQGSGGGLPIADIDAVASVACGALRPDLTIIFNLDEAAAAKRAGISPSTRGKHRDTASGSLFSDRIEDRGLSFFAKVRAGYVALAQRQPDRHALIDASGTPEEVWSLVLDTIERRLFPKAPG
jgi:dTMP kinase